MSQMASAPVTIYIRDGPGPTDKQMNKWRNSQQTHSLTSAHLLFIYGGMGLAMSIGYNGFSPISSKHYNFSFLIGAVIGAVVAAPFVNFLHAKVLIAFSTLCAITSGILFTSVPYQYESCLAARYLNGISLGITLVTFLMNSSEIAAKSYRGICLALEQFYMTIGIAVQIIYSTQWDVDFPVNRLHGILGIILGVFALLSVYFIIESPVFYLRKDNEAAALNSIKVSVRPCIVNDEVRRRFDTLKAYVRENENMGFGGAFVQGLWPFFKMICYRSCVALSFSLLINLALSFAGLITTGEPQNYLPIIFACIRIIGALISISLMDSVGRKAVSILSLWVMGGLIIGAGCIFGDNNNIADNYEMSVVCTLLLLAQFFAGLFSPSSSVFLGEAFPLLTKSYFIALTVCIEQVIHIIVICTVLPLRISLSSLKDFYDYGLSAGIILAAFGLLFCLIIPETTRTTLAEAQARFKKLFFLRCW